MRKISRRHRCDARLPVRDVARDRAIRAGKLSEFLRRNRCKNWALRGSKRCRLHGGLSTGPRTAAGMSRTIAGLVAGRARWLAELKAAGKPIPFGRKRGGRNLPKDQRDQVAYEKQCHRDARGVSRQTQADRKARRVREREENRRKMEDHARRKARADTGLPYWTDEEWEKL